MPKVPYIGGTPQIKMHTPYLNTNRNQTSKTNLTPHFTHDFYRKLREYEVLLSFLGKNTRASLTSNLYTSLQNAGINIYKDP